MEFLAFWLFAALITGLINLLLLQIAKAGIWGFVKGTEGFDVLVAFFTAFILPILSPLILIVVMHDVIPHGWTIFKEFRENDHRTRR